MTSLARIETMSKMSKNGQAATVHQRAKYGRYTHLLDRSYSRYTDADKVAAHRGYADDDANERADGRYADYQTARNLAAYIVANGLRRAA